MPAAGFRYGVVFLLVLVAVVVLIVAPAQDWTYAAAFALESAALVVVIATSRTRAAIRRVRAALAASMALAWALAVASGVVPQTLVHTVGGVLTILIPLTLVGGLLRLVRARGVTAQAVAGSLAIYLLLGLTFASLIGLAARVGSAPYFASGTDGTESTRVYFSFTVLTTTGFGDLTPDNQIGRALAVLEMLAGQLYLVTVIGVVVGNFRRR
jgi:ion channel